MAISVLRSSPVPDVRFNIASGHNQPNHGRARAAESVAANSQGLFGILLGTMGYLSNASSTCRLSRDAYGLWRGKGRMFQQKHESQLNGSLPRWVEGDRTTTPPYGIQLTQTLKRTYHHYTPGTSPGWNQAFDVSRGGVAATPLNSPEASIRRWEGASW